jgi:hypothetical protein
LLDVFKEADLRVEFTDLFEIAASREVIDRDTLRRRLLLALYGLGTKAGLKRMAGSESHQAISLWKLWSRCTELTPFKMRC